MQNHNFKISYEVNVASLSGHLFQVSLQIEHPEETGQILRLPAWIPGSYMIRDFAKNIVTISAQDPSGLPLIVEKIDKQSWQIQPCIGRLTIDYSVYAFDLSVRGAYINDEMAFFNGTNMFLAVQGQTEQACAVHLIKPKDSALDHWQVATTMPTTQQATHEFGDFWASNYQELIDHPVLLGEFDILPFSTPHHDFELILAGGHQADTERMVQDLQKICQHHLTFFGDAPPFKTYQFITLLTDNAFGGLEHISSTALMYSRNSLPDINDRQIMPDGYQVFLSLCSHEFFHTWHVKRIKPLGLADASLSTEAYTEQLWIYEGFTSYFDDLSLLRCGLIDQTAYLKIVAQSITRLIRNQGRFKQSITESSFDAWTKFYKQDEGAINHIVSYYNKGAILAMCLDLLIRKKSYGQSSLDDVMAYLWQQHGKTAIATTKDVVQKICREQLHLDMDDFFTCALYTTQELPFTALLQDFGVKAQLYSRLSLDDKGGTANNEIPSPASKIDFGAQLKAQEIGAKVLQVSQDSAAYRSGVQVHDIIIALGLWQISKENLQKQLDRLAPGEQVALTLLRDKKVKTLLFTAEVAKVDTVFLEVVDDSLIAKWLSP
jgi:predicted metalloprotease with PDZ domain